jgi:hypothetical protein
MINRPICRLTALAVVLALAGCGNGPARRPARAPDAGQAVVSMLTQWSRALGGPAMTSDGATQRAGSPPPLETAMRRDVEAAYADVFTSEERSLIAQLYATPQGRAALDRLPVLSARLAAIGQRYARADAPAPGVSQPPSGR